MRLPNVYFFGIYKSFLLHFSFHSDSGKIFLVSTILRVLYSKTNSKLSIKPIVVKSNLEPCYFIDYYYSLTLACTTTSSKNIKSYI